MSEHRSIPATMTPDAAYFWAMIYPTRVERWLSWCSLQLYIASECEIEANTPPIDPERSHGHLCRLGARLEDWVGFLRRRRVARRAS